jgi:uncharacterized protein (TIRG00374 family)
MSIPKEFKKKRIIFSFTLGFGLLAFFLYQSNLKEIWEQVKEAEFLPIALAFLLHYSTYLVRGYRWKQILTKIGFKGSSRGLGKITLIFQSVDCIVPAKLADFYGAHLVKLNYHLRRSASLGSILLQRFLDAVGSFLLIVGAVLFLFGRKIPSQIVSLIHWSVGFILAGTLMGVLFLWKSGWFSRHLPERLEVLVESFKEGLRPEMRSLPLLTGSTLLIWLLEAGRFYCICQSVHMDVGFSAAIIIPLAAAMASAIPFTPAGLGAVELVMVSLMTLLDFPSGPIKYSIIMLDRLVSYWSQIPIGLTTLGISGYSGMKIWNLQEETKTKNYQEVNP